MIDLFISTLSIGAACVAVVLVIRALAEACPIDATLWRSVDLDPAPVYPDPLDRPVPDSRLPEHGFDYRGFWIYRVDSDRWGTFYRAIDNRPGLYRPRWYPASDPHPIGILRSVDRLLDRAPIR